MANVGTELLSKVVKATMAPLWLAQLATGTKSFARNPIIGSGRLNERGLHAARVILSHRLAEARRRKLAGLITAEETEAFERDGYIVRRNFLPQADFQALLAQIKDYRGYLRELIDGDTILRQIAFAPQTLAELPAARALLGSPEWRRLVHYIGARNADPVVMVQGIYTHAIGGPPDPELTFHTDSFHPTVKAWLFLMDVGEDAAPLLYVAGSHKLTPGRLEWQRRTSIDARESSVPETREGSFRIDREELTKLGFAAPRAFVVPANTFVVADTFGFHARGPSADRSFRIEIFFRGGRSPFLPWTVFDPWTPAALGWRTMANWRLRDAIEAIGGEKNAWSASTRTGISIFDPPRTM